MSPKPSHQANPQSTSKAMSKGEAYRLYQVLGQLKGVVAEPRHMYALIRLRKIMQSEAESIEELSKPPERIQAFEAKRIEFCKEYSSKDANGNPVISPEKSFVIVPDRQKEFEGRMLSLQSEYKDDLESHQDNILKINTIAAEDSEVLDLPKISMSGLSGSISFEQMEILYPILIDETASVT